MNGGLWIKSLLSNYVITYSCISFSNFIWKLFSTSTIWLHIGSDNIGKAGKCLILSFYLSRFQGNEVVPYKFQWVTIIYIIINSNLNIWWVSIQWYSYLLKPILVSSSWLLILLHITLVVSDNFFTVSYVVVTDLNMYFLSQNWYKPFLVFKLLQTVSYWIVWILFQFKRFSNQTPIGYAGGTPILRYIRWLCFPYVLL